MRRTCSLAIAAFNFGHPHMGSGFGKVYVNNPDSKHIVESPVQRTTLSNGINVVTHDKGGAATTIGVYADAGVMYDPSTAPGLTHLARHALLGSNLTNSEFQIDRAFRSVGTAYGHSEINKRYFGVWAQGNRTSWRVSVEHFANAIAQPRFHESTLEKWRDNLDNQRSELRWTKPRDFVVNELESVAFANEPLGNPRQIRPESNDKASHAALIDKYASFMSPERLTLVGVNIGHEDLVAFFETQPNQMSASAPHFARGKTSLNFLAEEKQYQGGRCLHEFENRAGSMETKPDMNAEAIAAVGWLAHGTATLPQYAATLVFHQMLAMQTQQSLGFMERSMHDLAFGLESFYRPFNTAGLIGFTARSDPAGIVGLVQDALKSLPVDLVSLLPAAKARAAVAFYTENAETETAYADLLASSPASLEEILTAIEGVTITTLNEVAERTRASQPTLYATGDCFQIPTVRQLLRKH